MTGWRRAHILAISLLSLPILIAGECDDDPPTGNGNGTGGGTLTLPSSWANTYRITIDESSVPRGNGTQEIAIDVLCAGSDALEELFPDEIVDEEFDCSGTIGNGGADITCTKVDEIFTGCMRTRTVVFEATRNTSTGTITGSQTFTEELEGIECPTPEPTFVANVVAEVVDDASPGCAAGFDDSVHPDWGGTWDVTLTQVDCDTGEPVGDGFVVNFQPLYCPGEPADVLLDIPEEARVLTRLGGEEVETWGGFSSNGVDAFFSEQRFEECPGAQTFRFLMDRVGDSVTGTVDVLEYTFAYDPLPSCEETSMRFCVTVAATRLSSDTSGCIPVRN